jgi:hypothetical protein
MADNKHRFMSNGDGWARELFFMFVFGAVVASLFWLAVWYVQARPAQADALQEKDVTVSELEIQSRQCTAERDRLTEANQRLEFEVGDRDRKLRQAWTAHARCAREDKD